MLYMVSFEVRMRKEKKGWGNERESPGLWKPHSQTGLIHIKAAVRQDKQR